VSYFHSTLFAIRNTVSYIIKLSLVIRYASVTVSFAVNSKAADFTVLKNPIPCPSTASGHVVIKNLNNKSRNEFFCFGCSVVVVLLDTWPYLFRARVLLVPDSDTRVTIKFWSIGRSLLLRVHIGRSLLLRVHMWLKLRLVYHLRLFSASPSCVPLESKCLFKKWKQIQFIRPRHLIS
jgi:hypothetical protein